MKRKVNKISLLLLAFVLALSLGLPALAADSALTYTGKGKMEFTPGSGYTSTDLFDGFKDVMPGDKLTESITIRNKYKGCDYIKVYMRAEVHGENNLLTYEEAFEYKDGKDQAAVEGQRDENIATMSDFLGQLTMTVKHGDKILFEAHPNELDGLKDNVLIAKMEKGAEAELTVELNVPITMENTYANRVGEVDWVFTIEERNHPSNPQKPEFYPYVPMISSPKTGDSANIVLWAGLLVVAGGVAVYVMKKSKRQ